MYKIAVIPGDGTGLEMVNEGLKVLAAAQDKFNFKIETADYDLGGERYMRTGEVLPESALEELKSFDAIFLGAIGHPDVKPGILEKGLLLRMRFELDLYINLRPVKPFPALQHRSKTKDRKISTLLLSGKTPKAFTPGPAVSYVKAPRRKLLCRSLLIRALVWNAACVTLLNTAETNEIAKN